MDYLLIFDAPENGEFGATARMTWCALVSVACIRLLDALYRYHALQIEHRFARYFHAITRMCAEQLTASFRDLKRMEIVLAKHSCPIGS